MTSSDRDSLPHRNFNPDSDTWEMNFQRTVRRKNEDSIWMGWARNQGLRRITNAGHVTGISEVTQGHGFDVKPDGLATSEWLPDRAAPRRKVNGGLDLFSTRQWASSLGATTADTWVRGQTANRRVLAVDARFERGSFYSGTRAQTIAGLTLRAPASSCS